MKPKANDVRVDNLTVVWRGEMPAAKASFAYIDLQTGTIHGHGEINHFSEDTARLLQELSDSIRKDVLTIHFEEGEKSDRYTGEPVARADTGGGGNSSRGPTGGLGRSK